MRNVKTHTQRMPATTQMSSRLERSRSYLCKMLCLWGLERNRSKIDFKKRKRKKRKQEKNEEEEVE